MGCIIGGIACCFCSTAASLCCTCLPSCKNSTSTRLMYGLILILGAIVSCVFLAPSLKSELAKIPALCKPYSFVKIYSGFDCKLIAGFGAVYRVCFGLASFFFFFSILMIRVRSSRDPRAKIQNGFWFFKILAIICLMVGAFFIPTGSGFAISWLVIGMSGGFLFIIIQLVLLVDFAHKWNEKWVDAYEEDDNKAYYIALIVFTLLFYLSSFTGFVLLFVYYAGYQECSLNKFYISFNLILCAFMSVVSILPKVHKHMPRSGLLQSSMLTMYTVYLTWSGMSNGPNVKCNPSLTIKSNTSVIQSHSLSSTVLSVHESAEQQFSWTVIVGLVIFLATVIYSSIRSSGHASVGRLTMNGYENAILRDQGEESGGGSLGNKSGQMVYDNEEEAVVYNYCFLHVMFFLGSLYIMMTLTNWYKPSSDLMTLYSNEASVWVKIVSSWICIAVYLWTLLAPCIFTDRQFS